MLAEFTHLHDAKGFCEKNQLPFTSTASCKLRPILLYSSILRPVAALLARIYARVTIRGFIVCGSYGVVVVDSIRGPPELWHSLNLLRLSELTLKLGRS